MWRVFICRSRQKAVINWPERKFPSLNWQDWPEQINWLLFFRKHQTFTFLGIKCVQPYENTCMNLEYVSLHCSISIPIGMHWNWNLCPTFCKERTESAVIFRSALLHFTEYQTINDYFTSIVGPNSAQSRNKRSFRLSFGAWHVLSSILQININCKI